MMRGIFKIPVGISIMLVGIWIILLAMFLQPAQAQLVLPADPGPVIVLIGTPVQQSTNRSPEVVFSSSEDGAVTYGGPCYFSHTPTLEIAVAGPNTVTYGPLAVGTYSGCTITVTNAAGETATATIADFEIVPETGTENHTVQVSTDRQTVAWGEEFTITLKTEIPVLAVVDDYENENFHHLGHTDVHIKQLVTFGHIGTIDPPEQPQADLKNFTFAARISYIGNFEQLLDGFDLHLQVHTERFRFKSCSQPPCWNSPSNIVPIVLDPFKYSITGVTAPTHFDNSRSKFNVTITTDAVALTQFDQSLINISEGRVVPNSEIYNGNEVTFKIEPQNGNEIIIHSIGKGAFREVSYNGTRAYNTPVTIPSATLPKFDLTIDKGAGTGKGTVTGDGLSCTVDDASNTTSGVCIVSVPGGGARYIFKAVPAAGSVFGGWNGTCDDPQDLDPAIAGAETCFHPIEDEAATVTPVFELASSLSIEITDDDPDPVPAGSLLTYTVAVTNSGTVDATGVVVDATLPAEFSYQSSGGDPSVACTTSPAMQCTIPTVRADETVTFKLIGYVDVAAVDPLTLEVAVSSTSLDDERTQLNPKTDSQVTTVTAPMADVEVSVVHGGGTGKGTVTGTVFNCVVDDTSGQTTGTCTDTITPFESLMVQATPDPGSTFDGWGVNSCDIEDAATNACTLAIDGNNATETITPIFTLLLPNLSATITQALPDPVMRNGTLVYTVVVTNGGQADAKGVSVAMTLPGEVDFDRTSTECADTGNSAECALGTLGIGMDTSFTVTVAVQPAAVGPLDFAVVVSSEAINDIGAGKSDNVSTPVISRGTVTIIKKTRQALAGNDTFVFGFSKSTIAPITLTTVNNTATSDPISTESGPIIITETAVARWRLKSAQCVGGLNGDPVADVESGSIGIDLLPGGNTVCTFISEPDSDFVVERTQTVIRNFITDRADQIAAGELSLAQRLLNRAGGGVKPACRRERFAVNLSRAP